MKLSKHSLHRAAVFFVAAELTRRGCRVLNADRPRRLPLVASVGSRKIPVAVYSTQEGRGPRRWLISDRHEKREVPPGLMFVLVRMNGLNEPAYHIVPGADAVQQMDTGHKKWRATPGRHGQLHNYSSVRLFRDPDDLYLNRWELITAPQGKAQAAKRKPQSGSRMALK